jgi:hypothetical protein
MMNETLACVCPLCPLCIHMHPVDEKCFQENIRLENDEVKREEMTRQFEKFINELEKKHEKKHEC